MKLPVLTDKQKALCRWRQRSMGIHNLSRTFSVALPRDRLWRFTVLIICTAAHTISYEKHYLNTGALLMLYHSFDKLKLLDFCAHASSQVRVCGQRVLWSCSPSF
jgi:hypothetical protein